MPDLGQFGPFLLQRRSHVRAGGDANGALALLPAASALLHFGAATELDHIRRLGASELKRTNHNRGSFAVIPEDDQPAQVLGTTRRWRSLSSADRVESDHGDRTLKEDRGPDWRVSTVC